MADWNRILDIEQEFSLGGLDSPPLEAEFNRSMYRIYQGWAADAEQVLERTRALAARGCEIGNTESLEDAYGRVSARLKLTPEMLARATDQVRRSDAVPIEEVRNELRTRVRS